nr:NAD(P)-binding domain-containing protein [Caulobacteraceae bacterium]
MGGALLAGWRRCGAFSPSDLMVLDPQPAEAALAAYEAGAKLNPPERELALAATVVMAVKPQIWRAVAAEIEPHLAPEATVISILAGVEGGDLADVFGGRAVARVMPTLASAIGKGAAAVYAPGALGRRRARELFEPLGLVIDLDGEASMHAVTAVCGSAPAYLYAFVEALGAAAAGAGLS